MALTQCPENWRLFVDLPDERDQGAWLERSWSLPLQEPVAYHGQEFSLQGPLQVRARTGRAPEGVELELHLEGKVQTQCSKCLSPLAVAIEEDFLYCYVLQTDELGEEPEEYFSDSGRVTLPVKQLKGPMDIGSLVWECLVVSLPAFAVCPQGCKGLEAYLSKEDQADPRFQVLAGLLSTSEKEGNNDGNAQDESLSS